MGNRGENQQSYALYEELRHLRVSPEAGTPYIYKRLDTEVQLPVEERVWQIRVPVPSTKGIRKSLKVSDKEVAISKAEEMVLEIKVQLKQGIGVMPTPVEFVVDKFLAKKLSLVRDAWESKEDKGRKSITDGRYELIAGKLRNYLVPFLGAKTDARSIPARKWNEWNEWRVKNSRTKPPKAITIQNEMGMIREFWKWGMENGFIPFSPKLPFQDENLAADDKVKRATWEAHEWSSFARLVREWLNAQYKSTEEHLWDCWTSYQMLFFLANCGMRIGEVVKVKRRDIQFYQLQERPDEWMNGKICALVQVHPSTKTGAREVNAMGGEFAKRVWENSKFKKQEDFLFCHLDGTPFTTKQFRKKFNEMIAFTNEDERWGKHFVPYSLRHLYATTRLQHGTSRTALCENMGVGEIYLRKHYSKYLSRLATADLMKMDRDIGLGGKIISRGNDFAIPEATE